MKTCAKKKSMTTTKKENKEHQNLRRTTGLE